MQKHPKCDLTILCGHTHSPGEAAILLNLLIRTGGARLRQPLHAGTDRHRLTGKPPIQQQKRLSPEWRVQYPELPQRILV